jgi:DHA2 family multidrug resistance protein
MAMCAGMFMAILDIQIVASSLPDIQIALHLPQDQLSWLQTSYLIAEVIAIPLTGWLSRLLSVRLLFVAADIGFTLASLGCASSYGLTPLLIFRVIQGFCGGALIPVVFTSVFTMFPERSRLLATTVGGVFAMLAPTVGPVVGGYITETYSWHWLFLINLGPGVLVAAVAFFFVRPERPDWSLWRRLDYLSLLLVSVCLASLELGLKEGPGSRWTGWLVLGLLATSLISGSVAIWRCTFHPDAIVDIRCFADRRFRVACLYSFVLGMGLYGAVYMLPLYLAFVRQHTPLEIGTIMIAMGAAQLASAPFAALAEKRLNRLWLTGFGFALFAGGLIANGFMTIETDAAGLFWPQILRGSALLFCLLPITTLALERQPPERVASASGLFNLQRNLGGAIGIALIDTILQQRVPVHAATLVQRLQAGDPNAARIVGLPLARFNNVPLGPIDEATKAQVAPLVEQAALVLSFNDAWLAVGALFAVSLLALPWLRRVGT